jgi:hypothetical protein
MASQSPASCLESLATGPGFRYSVPGGQPLRILTLSLLFVLCGAFAVEAPGLAGRAPITVEPDCGTLGTPLAQTTLYFGLNRKSGTVSEREWRAFLRDQVTTRFPQGFTVWEANGQWRKADGRIARERSKVLLLVHDESPELRKNVSQIVDTYKRMFEQESVLWETARVCAAF